MQSEQVLFEGRNCPVTQRFETRPEYIKRLMEEREAQKREYELNMHLDRMAKEAEFMDRYEQGYTSL